MKKFDVVEWMAKYGHTSYQDKIRDIQERMNLKIAEAGPNGQFCSYLADDLKRMEQNIAEIKREAEDRYQDWATDGEDNYD